MKRITIAALAVAVLAGTACEGSDPAGPGEVITPVASVVVGPSGDVTVSPGQTAQLTAKALGADGSELAGRGIVWTSSRPDVASVTTDGLVQGSSEGLAVITASSEGVGASVQVTVEAPLQEPAVGGLEIRPRLVVTYAGVAAPLTATVRADDGSVLTGKTIVWTSSHPEIAVVDENGVVRGLQEGEAVITASVQGKQATAAFTSRANSTYHLAYDRNESAFLWMDMRRGSATKAMDHGASIRSTDPSPSPTRSGFAYVHTNDVGGRPYIAIQSWNGHTYTFLTDGDQPAWSPDGMRIAFRRVRDGRADIWVTPADAPAEAVNLTSDLPAGTDSERPAWSPAGDRLVFAASNARGSTDLWVMRANGGEKRALTNGPHLDSEPTWFGDRIVFTRRTAAGASDLYWMFVNGAAVQPLTASGDAQMPAWAPDGRWIAFVVREGESGVGDLYAVRPDGSDVRALSLRSDGPTGGGLNPAWTLHW